MTATKSIRDRLGLSQEQMAEWLGISRSHLANHESEKRSLPTAALLQMAKLEKMLFDMQKQKQSKTKQPMSAEKVQRHKAAKQKFERHAEIYLHKARGIKMKLDAIKLMHEQTKKWAAITEMLIAEKINDKKNRRELLWLQVQQQETANKLKKCDEVAQMKIQLRIEMFEALGKMNARLGDLKIW